jgi:DUF438 domain-containing protein
MEANKSMENLQENKAAVKEMIRKLRGNENKEEAERLSKEFEALIAQVNPMAIALAEQDLLGEGYSFSDLKTACDVHLAVFKGAIEDNFVKVPEGHPIHYFQEEHKEAEIKGSKESAQAELAVINKIAQKLMDAESHNVRQENTLFPVLEKHGVTAPPAIMWEEHTDMKEQKKKLIKEVGRINEFPFQEYLNRLEVLARVLLETFYNHSQKENHILYETAMNTITEDEWKDIKEECDNLGYVDLRI